MPYTATTAPAAVKKLPPKAKRTFIAAFNNAYKEYGGDEAKSHATAWSAVKNKFEKKKSGQWGRKSQSAEEEKSMTKLLQDLKGVYETFRQAAPEPQDVDLSGVKAILNQIEADPQNNLYRLADLDRQFVAAIGFDLKQCGYDACAGPSDYNPNQFKETTLNTEHSNSFPGSLQHRIRMVLNAFHEDETQQTYLGSYGFVLAVYPDAVVTCAADEPYDYDGDADYWRVEYKMADDFTVTFGDAKQVDVGTVVVPYNTMNRETWEEESSEQGSDAMQNQDDKSQTYKTDNGQKFNKSAYLIIPDPKLPSTWKIRVEETPGKITTHQLGAAHAALTGNYRGQTLDATAEQKSAALKKLKSLYKSHGLDWPEDKKQSSEEAQVVLVSTDERPDWLKQGQDPPGGEEELVQSQSYILQTDGYNEKTGVLRVKGTATTADVINSKKQVYPMEVWQSNLPRLTRKLSQGKLLGESEHPSDGQATLDRTCIKFNKLWQEGNELKFEADILPTEPYGKNLQVLIQNGVAVDISSRGRGTTKIGEWRGTPDVAIVQQGFRCDAFDCVVAGASPNSNITDWQLQSSPNAAAEEEEMPALTPEQQAQLDKMAAFADKFDAFMANQNQNAENKPAETSSDNTVVTQTSQNSSDVTRMETVLAQMNKHAVNSAISALVQEQSKKWPVVWVNMYEKRLRNANAKDEDELRQASEKAIEDIDSLYQSAPKFPGQGFIIEKDRGERGFQRPIDLIDEMVSDLSDEFDYTSDPRGIFTQKDENGKPMVSGSFRTPRRQCKQMLINIANHVDEAWNGRAAMNGLLQLTQGYGMEEINDYLYQTISPAGTTAVGAGGAPSSAIFIFPLVRRIFPQLIATELASVQPMDRPDGKIFFLDAERTATGSGYVDEGGNTVSDYMRIDRSDSFSSSYADDPGETTTAALIRLRLSSKTVTAATKKLYSNWSIEEMQDLRAYHGLDAALELVGALSRQIALEWNETVLDELVAGATGSNRTYGTTAPSGYTQKEWDEYLPRYLDAVSNDIYDKRYGDITHIIASASSWNKLGASFRAGTNPRSGPEPEQYAGLTLTPWTSVSMPGIKTYKTGFWRTKNVNTILCLRRGTDWSDTPYVWAPYIDYVSPTLTLPDVFTQKQGLMSRVAHLVVVGDAIGTVTIASGTGVTV